MTDETLLTKDPQVDPGTYMATVANVERANITTAEGDKELLRWSFKVETDDGVADMSALSSLSYGHPSAKNTKWATALLGNAPDTLSADDLVGAQGMVVVDLDANGYAKVVDLVARPKGSK